MSQEKADRFAGMLGRGGGNQSRGGLSGGGGSGPQSSGEDKQVAAATASGGGDTNITINMDQLVSFDVRSTNGKLELTQEDLNKIYQQLLGLLNNATGMAGS
jgi:hypothetical protein